MVDRVIALIVFLIAAGYLYMASQFPRLEIGDPLGPKIFPVILGTILILTAILLVFESFRKPEGDARKSDEPEEKGNKHLLVILAVALVTLVYVLVLEKVGYILDTFLLLMVTMAYFNRNKYVQNGIIAIAFSLIFYLMFAKLLGVTLPKGLFYF
ncbi:MAG: tripartite tricarboxylate transporter TctB family protein [Desulfocucumaceae bacterium]